MLIWAISLGDNLPNLLRLALRSFTKLRNTIETQTMDASTKKWSREMNGKGILNKDTLVTKNMNLWK